MQHPSEPFYLLPEPERVARTRAAIAAGVPLMDRWREMSPEIFDRWTARAAVAAELLRPARSICDIGCGSMVLEKYLAPGQIYIPVDLVTRDARTVVIDLNKDSSMLPVADAAAVLGTFEYLYDTPSFIASLRRYSSVVISYIGRMQGERTEAREANGWVVHFTREQFIAAWTASGFLLKDMRPFEPRQDLFVFQPTAAGGGH